MARTNYGQAKRQKELARKARQQEKMTRRATKPQDGLADGEAPADAPADAGTVPAGTPETSAIDESKTP